MTKTELKQTMQRLGMEVTDVAIGRLWGISQQAVQLWDKIPELRVYQLKESHPHLIGKKRSRKA